MLQDPNLRHPIAISLGAVAGALSRYYITLWFANRFGTAFPYGTFFRFFRVKYSKKSGECIMKRNAIWELYFYNTIDI